MKNVLVCQALTTQIVEYLQIALDVHTERIPFVAGIYDLLGDGEQSGFNATGLR